MIHLYLAAPLFSVAEQGFNRDLRSALVASRRDLSVVLPQERAPELLRQEGGFKLVFDDCLEMIDRCTVVVALLEGPDADSGTCIELGYAYAKGKPIIGVRTDHRASEEHGLNLMASNVCTRLLRGEAKNAGEVAERIISVLNEVIGVRDEGPDNQRASARRVRAGDVGARRLSARSS